jgi:surfeit locus 1 family protein
VAVCVAAVCVRLGIWQLDRLQQRRVFNEAVARGLASPPMPLEEALRGGGDPAGLAYRRVLASGTYDPAHEVILYGRTLDGRPGNHVLTPLVLGDGGAVMVDRGWIPFQPNQPLPVPGEGAAPGGVVTVDGFLVLAQASTPPGAAPVTTIQRIDLTLLQGQIPYRLAPLALQLESQTPPPGALPVSAPLPELSEGPHLSYAIQWFSFAAIAIVGASLILRRDRRDRRERVAASGAVAARGAGEASSSEEGR